MHRTLAKSMSQESDDDRERGDEPQLQTSGWVDQTAEAAKREFPIKGLPDQPLRIAFTAEAHAEIVEHAEETLDRELCGVLLGTLCEDDAGVWVSAEVALRGETDKQGGTHVTYTHETWEKIYEVKEEQYPDLSILGWYHTHPGFGVQFSEMDLFIQRNFFPGETQFALVIDPTSGKQAIIANTSDDCEYVERFCVDGEKRVAEVPVSERRNSGDEQHGSELGGGDVDGRLRDVEARLSQVLQSNESLREAHGRLFLTFGFLCAMLMAGFIGYLVYDRIVHKLTPPEDLQMVKVPVRINDKVMMVGMQVRGWEIPDGENLLEKSIAEAERRAVVTAMQLMQDPQDPEALKSVQALQPSGWDLRASLTLTWAVVATLAVFVLLFFGRRSPESDLTESP